MTPRQHHTPTNSRSSCPCQHISLSLSSATAAEYGDIESLHRRLQKKRSNEHPQQTTTSITNGGITPLHLASQNNHPAAVSLLLSEGGFDVNTGLSNNDASSFCGATPLHRASFSGATAAMKILLDWGNESKTNILAKDTSFGDKKTPLHKAVAGGRPLAVRLLLMYLRQQDLLKTGLDTEDSKGLTPLASVKQYTCLEPDKLEAEECSVRRWDSIAGGHADWGRCQTLLEKAFDDLTTPSLRVKINPLDLCNNGDDCKEGSCKTNAWENAFKLALVSSLGSSCGPIPEPNTPVTNAIPLDGKNQNNNLQEIIPAKEHENIISMKLFGRVCHVCQETSPTLFRLNNALVCRRCKRSEALGMS